jgi:hypothetical protein
LKVLLLFNPESFKNNNNFPSDLIKSLQQTNEFSKIDYGVKWLNSDKSIWDVIHIHWPECLTNWSEPDKEELDLISFRLASWSKISKIVTTVHNLENHYLKSDNFEKLYQIVYKFSSGFIHLAESSVSLVKLKYYELVTEKYHEIISHGNYNSLKDNDKVIKNFENKVKTILVVGALRNIEEVNTMFYSFKKISIKNVKLVFLGRLPPFKNLLINQNINNKIKLILILISLYVRIFVSRRIVFYIGYVTNRLLLENIKSADIIFIPRRDVLNSGNIALGFTFGKVVVGPNIGNVGLLLKVNNNPTFEIDADYKQISNKLLEGLLLAKEDVGKKNLKYSETVMDWDKIAFQHYLFYKKVLK